MSLSPLLTGVGMATGAVVTGAVKAVNSGLSFSVELAKQALAPVAEPEAQAPAEISPEEQRDELLKRFRERLEERLKTVGITLSQPIVLEASPSGSLRVMNDHPQWRQIEQTLGDDESFASQFAQLQAAVKATGVDERSARDMSLELSSDAQRVILPR